MSEATKLEKCRICGNTHLVEVVDLGVHYLTGVFPRENAADTLTKGPLRLVKCEGGAEACDLLQLDHTYDLDEMYGDNYGYRSGLNRQMVEHLTAKITGIQKMVAPIADDLVIDIGANDGTSLGVYDPSLTLVGIDPSAEKFRRHYKPHVQLIPDFFSARLVEERFPGRKAKIVTSFSMFYDLENPLAFAADVAAVLDPEGVWVLEQSYMPLMIDRVAYDTICHEHLEYYGLRQIQWIAEKVGLKLIDVEFNDVNGGSFSVVVAPGDSARPANSDRIGEVLAAEKNAGLGGLEPYLKFRDDIERARAELAAFVSNARREGKRVAGLGASTKGNVVLQYCGFTPADLETVGEVNPDKFGALTPGTWIPISDERDVLASGYDYLIVLPWHFRSFFESSPAMAGQQLVFPLPKLEVVAL